LVGEGGVIYTDAKEKRSWNAVPICVLLRKNFWNGVLVHSITKILQRNLYPVILFGSSEDPDKDVEIILKWILQKYPV
jgi:hypothetical protein